MLYHPQSKQRQRGSGRLPCVQESRTGLPWSLPHPCTSAPAPEGLHPDSGLWLLVMKTPGTETPSTALLVPNTRSPPTCRGALPQRAAWGSSRAPAPWPLSQCEGTEGPSLYEKTVPSPHPTGHPPRLAAQVESSLRCPAETRSWFSVLLCCVVWLFLLLVYLLGTRKGNPPSPNFPLPFQSLLRLHSEEWDGTGCEQASDPSQRARCTCGRKSAS